MKTNKKAEKKEYILCWVEHSIVTGVVEARSPEEAVKKAWESDGTQTLIYGTPMPGTVWCAQDQTVDEIPEKIMKKIEKYDINIHMLEDELDRLYGDPE